MVEVRSKTYLKMYEDSIKTDEFREYALITTKDGEKYIDSEVSLESETITGVIEKHPSDIVKAIFYSRPIGLIDDIEVYGPITNVEKIIYFGRRMSVYEANSIYGKALELPFEDEVIVLDNGEVVTEIEENVETSYEVLENLKQMK